MKSTVRLFYVENGGIFNSRYCVSFHKSAISDADTGR
jgi:hypothetical protein